MQRDQTGQQPHTTYAPVRRCIRYLTVFVMPAAMLLAGIFWLHSAAVTPARADSHTVLYVASGAGGANDGSSWANAYNDLQSALTTAATLVPANTVEIWVAGGVYRPSARTEAGNARTATFQLLDGVGVYGGFAGTETLREQRDWTANVTVLSGDIDSNDTTDANGVVSVPAHISGSNAYHVVTGSGTGGTAVLDGVTVTGGKADGNSAYRRGGGIYNDAGSPTLSNLIFSGNHATVYGGGIFNFNSSPTLINVTVSGSYSERGGGIFNESSSPALINATLSGNDSNYGGGIFNYYSHPTLTNVILSGNTATGVGGGIYNASSSPTLINVTLSGNRVPYNGGGIFNDGGSAPAIHNSILWNNQDGGGTDASAQLYNSGSPTISHTLIQGSGGSSSWDSSLGNDGGGNLDVDPQFVSPVDPATAPTTAGDVHLLVTSPARDAGDTGALPADGEDLDGDGDTTEAMPYDLDNSSRVAGGAVDMGAYETKMTVQPSEGLTIGEAGGSAPITVTLLVAPSDTVTVTVTGSNPAEATVSAGQLVFTPANWNTAQSVTVTGTDDDVDDGDTAYTVAFDVASSDPLFSGLFLQAQGSIADDDTAGVTATPAGGLTTSETGDSDSFTVVLDSEPTATVTVTLSSSDASEGTVGPTQLLFDAANWQTPQTVTVTGVDDDIDDGEVDYTIAVTVSSDDAAYEGMAVAGVMARNGDDDSARVTISPTAGLVTTEAGGSDSFTVTLDSEPTATVALLLSSDNGSEVVLSASFLQFTPANWNTPQTVTVSGVDDDVDDGDIAYSITVSAVSGDATYDTFSQSVAGINEDDDVAGVSISPSLETLSLESGHSVTITLSLNSRPTAAVTITLSSDRPDVAAIHPGVITFTPNNWDTAQTVTISPVGAPQGQTPFTIAIAVSSADASYHGYEAGDIGGVQENGYQIYIPMIGTMPHTEP